jgi:hypothetical protein
MRGASGDECGKLLGQEYNRPAEAGVLKKSREATLTFFLRKEVNGNALESCRIADFSVGELYVLYPRILC